MISWRSGKSRNTRELRTERTAIVSSALSQPPLLWPVATLTIPHLLPTINLLPSLGGTLHAVQRWLLSNTVGMLHLP